MDLPVLVWVMTGLVALVIAFLIFLAASLVDEDVNHWFWPSVSGPGLAWNIRWLALSVICGVVLAFGPIAIVRAVF
jgi:hypothetical protein